MPVVSSTEMAEFRALTEELAFADAYDLKRDGTPVSDGAGGATTTESTVESDACNLTMGLSQPSERIIAERAGYQAPYVVELPYATGATPSDRLLIDGRTFEIGGVLKDGYFGIAARAVCQQVG